MRRYYPWSDIRIQVSLPADLDCGAHAVVVTSGSQASNGIPFTVTVRSVIRRSNLVHWAVPGEPASPASPRFGPLPFGRRNNTCQGNPRTASVSLMDFRQRLLDLIDQSGLSDREISLLATGNTGTVRNIRRGTYPCLDTVEALCRTLGYRLEVVPLNDRRHRPVWSYMLEKEIRRDCVKILGRSFPRRYPRSRKSN